MTTELRRRILEALSETATAAPYALIDYPNYLNPGDAAIWLGARRVLEALNGRPPAYTSTLRGFSATRCRRAIGTGTVYFLGGGNFGDLYPRHQRMRLNVLRSLPDNAIVQLPMSCAMAASNDLNLLGETRALYRGRSSIRIFARDMGAQAVLQECFGLQSVLCADLSHMLDFPILPARLDVVRLMRRDPETLVPNSISAPDWRDMRGQRFANRLGKLFLALAPPSYRGPAQDRVAMWKVHQAVAMLAEGRVVETDRLHAALLAMAMGRQVVLHDNSTGKVLSYCRTWRALLPEGALRQPALAPGGMP
ncbi:polysaccharide pyruvyl transferase family protein [Shinella curvata]|uniref:Polysaccharide pyruvyl transferase family protein n=1 Tax=Shinella curvata TaxID=1817964 RepID=A0ABT8XC15_9HYPH|nr:polysaccharide pyruvyl transferase family protein [Shinella curvata]MCJ8054126.1 polysaccharide pyruvyl transferase family protein [Shinella curvata]MDO6121148.1 polysaccharide pyruvyl transferase family protein [Shinella curvata]